MLTKLLKLVFVSEIYFHVPVCAEQIKSVSTCLCLEKHYYPFLVMLTKLLKLFF